MLVNLRMNREVRDMQTCPYYSGVSINHAVLISKHHRHVFWIRKLKHRITSNAANLDVSIKRVFSFEEHELK